MHRILPVLVMLCTTGAADAGDARPSSDARPSMPYSGTATMQDDGTISLRLELTSDGKPASDVLSYKKGDRAYDDILRHLGGLRPGQTRSFRPWKS
jgi:hypothetical protein